MVDFGNVHADDADDECYYYLYSQCKANAWHKGLSCPHLHRSRSSVMFSVPISSETTKLWARWNRCWTAQRTHVWRTYSVLRILGCNICADVKCEMLRCLANEPRNGWMPTWSGLKCTRWDGARTSVSVHPTNTWNAIETSRQKGRSGLVHFQLHSVRGALKSDCQGKSR